MTQKQIYNLAIKSGIATDFRGKKEIDKLLARRKKQYEKLRNSEKQEFDTERLTNPYSDTRILVPTKKPIKRILAGIDMEVGEVLLAHRLGDIDLVLSHHPEGSALAGLDDVMHLQADVLAHYGVPINIAESLILPRIREVSRGISPINHNRAVDAAKLLNIGFMCVHTASDNMVAQYLRKRIEKKKPEYVEDLLAFLKSIPEYKEAIKIGAGPHLLAGRPENRCGKIALTEITGGTEGAPQIYEKMSQAGIGTTVAMHLSEKHYKQAKAAHINVVVAGHMSSDSLGLNLFLDKLAQNGVEIVPCSGLIRIERFKKK
ncbi:NGG1p interacting factor NIF3 [Patescibacteria group bacterium AH-259-L07]|nr:NGG1p interacting factor NIF3 [Patescibacteria group bacterium AH-259-L07]